MTKYTGGQWTRSVVSQNAKLLEVIEVLTVTGLRIVLVCDPNQVLLGIVTDGDLRRALLSNNDLNTCVTQIMCATPVVVNTHIDRASVLSLMRTNNMHHLPVVDEAGKLIGLHTLEEVITPTSLDNTVVIMAGGFGKRMGSRTKDLPKPMLKVHGKPMLEHIIMRAANEGFSEFVITLHYLPDIIKSYFGDGSRWNVRINYVEEAEPLGTAGSLSLLTPRPKLPFIVTNGDVMTDISFCQILNYHEQHEASATMAVRHHEWENPFGVVKTNGIIIDEFEEKPVYRSNINAGVYVLEPSALGLLKKGKLCDMPNIFEALKQDRQKIIAYPLHEGWVDVGRPKDLIQINSKPPVADND